MASSSRRRVQPGRTAIPFPYKELLCYNISDRTDVHYRVRICLWLLLHELFSQLDDLYQIQLPDCFPSDVKQRRRSLETFVPIDLQRPGMIPTQTPRHATGGRLITSFGIVCCWVRLRVSNCRDYSLNHSHPRSHHGLLVSLLHSPSKTKTHRPQSINGSLTIIPPCSVRWRSRWSKRILT